MTVPIRGVTGYRAAPRAALDAFLAAPRLMRLGVTEPDGTPLVHPVWYTWQHDHFLVHLGTRSAKRRAIEAQPIVYFTIDEARPGTVFGVRGKAQSTLAVEATRVREVVQAQCDHYVGARDSTTHRFLLGMVERGELILAMLTPHALVTWGL
jgi:pyridoxamine 5'-phosphate oxidase-like protein